MSDLISFDTLVDNLNTEINALAVSLKSAGKIDREIKVAIVPHYQDNEEEKDYTDTARTAGIAYRGQGAFAPSQTYQGYNDRVIIIFDAFTNDADDIDYLLNEYANQNTGKFIKSNDWVYSGTFEKPVFLNRSVDKEQRINVVFEVLYNFVYKGIISDDIVITINGVEVPVLSYSSKIEKRGPVVPTIGSNGLEQSIFNSGLPSKTIKFIHINDTQINNILEDIDSAEYLNRQYTIVYTVTGVYTNSHTMVLSSGSIDFAEGQFQTIEATFLPYIGI